MATEALIEEIAAALIDGQLGAPLDEHQAHRFERVARELARRDYRFRPHGRECTCADCWYLWDTWTSWWRRVEQTITDDS